MKNLAFSVILFGLCWLLIEAMSLTAHFLKFGGYNLHAIHLEKSAAAKKELISGVYQASDIGNTEEATDQQSEQKPEQKQQETSVRSVLHPYVGYTVEGRTRIQDCSYASPSQCYRRVRVASDLPMPKRSAQQLQVAILGGSFADGVARLGHQALAAALQEYPAYKSREVIVTSLAAGGYKQPQQVTHLSYFLALGAEFDLIINIDGFNEVATPFTAYRDRHIHPIYPLNWDHRTTTVINPQHTALLARKQNVLARQSSLARLMQFKLIRHSPTLNFLWKLSNHRAEQRSADLDLQMAELTTIPENKDMIYQSLGPDYHFTDWQAFHAYTADIWMRGSLSLKALADSIGAEYFHYIQPNQYIEGSKPLSEYEKEKTVLASGAFGNVYQITYPLLLPRGEKLKQAGVRFEDLTYIFSDIRNSLYIDNCCHINPEGNVIIARRIGRKIVAALSSTEDQVDAPLAP